MRRGTTTRIPFEDLWAGCVALVAAAVCVLALFDLPAATATRGVSYADFVRAPAVETPGMPVFAPRGPDRLAGGPQVDPLPTQAVPCSTDTEADPDHVLALCRS